MRWQALVWEPLVFKYYLIDQTLGSGEDLKLKNIPSEGLVFAQELNKKNPKSQAQVQEKCLVLQCFYNSTYKEKKKKK